MKESTKKDYYVKVMLYQIFLSAAVVLFIVLFMKDDAEFQKRFLRVVNENLEGVELKTAVETFSGYVSGLKSSLIDTSEAIGGKDLTYKEATENTSFAPVFATSEICKPIEDGRYTSYFGYRINPVTGVYGFHTGVDIAAPSGTQIRSAYNGRVTATGTEKQTGKYVLIEHNDGFSTFYCHCSKVLVNEGTVIRAGETVALVGSTGYSTGPHLHFEVRKGGIKYNPMWLLENK